MLEHCLEVEARRLKGVMARILEEHSPGVLEGSPEVLEGSPEVLVDTLGVGSPKEEEGSPMEVEGIPEEVVKRKDYLGSLVEELLVLAGKSMDYRAE